jgi:hypothetical protein
LDRESSEKKEKKGIIDCPKCFGEGCDADGLILCKRCRGKGYLDWIENATHRPDVRRYRPFDYVNTLQARRHMEKIFTTFFPNLKMAKDAVLEYLDLIQKNHIVYEWKVEDLEVKNGKGIEVFLRSTKDLETVIISLAMSVENEGERNKLINWS